MTDSDSEKEYLYREPSLWAEQEHTGEGDNIGGNQNVTNNNVQNQINITHQYENRKQSKKRRLEFVIEGSVSECDSSKLYTILTLLQQIGGDAKIMTDFTDEGSIHFILDGSDEGLQKLADLQESGELEALLNKLKPDNIQEIKVKQAKFTKDKIVIEKAQLIKNIREGKADKKKLNSIDLVRANLRNSDLKNADLRNADLYHADLSYANLRNANLSYADLGYADLSYADLGYGSLYHADLSDVDLRHADLSYADLSYADLSYADLSYTDLSYSDLKYVNFRWTKIEKTIQLAHKWLLVHEIINDDQDNRVLHLQDLSYADLRSVYLVNANLIGVNLTSSDLSDAFLQQTNFSGANLTNANLTNANLINTVFNRAIVKGTEFGRGRGMSNSLKRNLKARGAIFTDDFDADDRKLARA